MGFPKGAAVVVKISEIRHVRSLVCIILDNGESYWLRRDDLPGTGFMENESFSSDTFSHWIRIRQYPRALNLAVSMLARRPCSKHEIRQKLLHHRYTAEVTELVLFKLEKEQLLNDTEFCEQWIRYRLSCKYGLSAIHRELRIKGIPEEMILEALEKTNPDENTNNAFSLAVKQWKKIRKEEDPYKTRQKIISYLVRKGYDWSSAKEACMKAEQETQNK